MLWGVNIHPTYKLPVSQQVALAKAMGLSSVRVDVYDASLTTIAMLTGLLAAAAPLGISVLPVICPGAAANEAAAYNANRSLGAALAGAVPTVFGWECGNELDEYAIIPGRSGSSRSDYDPGRYMLCRGAIRGLIDGVKSARPTAQVAVNIADVHFPFLQELWNNGVRWDITSWHFYCVHGATGIVAGAGSLFSQLAHFGKPILMTEFNQTQGSIAGPDTPVLTDMMDAVKAGGSTYNVIGAYIYELLDEPSLANSTERQYGLADASGNLNAAGLAVQGYPK